MYDAYRIPAAPPPPPAPVRKPFWSRPKVGAAGVVLGLLIGVGSTGDAEPDDDSLAKAQPTVKVVQQGVTDEEVQQQVDDAVETATSGLEDELAAQEEQAAADLRDQAARAKKAQSAAVKKAVAKALADAPAKVVEVPVEQPAAPADDTEPATDPDFGTCADAKAAGYGPYYAGQDPEYDWYNDRDGDGVVCE